MNPTPIKIECAHDEMVQIEKLIPHPRNPNKHPEKQIALLVKIIAAQGWRNPIVVSSRSGFITKGHARLEAAKILGCDAVPVDFQDYENEASEYADMIADNRIAELAEPSLPEIKDLLEELDTGAFDMDLTGFDTESIEKLMTQFHVPVDGLTDEDAIPENVETRCKKGDLWALGEHRLLCGDSTVLTDVEKLMNGEKADMVFTDPLYGMRLDADFSEMKGIAGGNKYENVIGDDIDYDPSFILSYWVKCKEIILWGADYYAERIQNRNTGSWFVWDKTGAGVSPNTSYEKMFGSNFELCWSKAKHKRQVVPVLWKGIFGLSEEDVKKRVHPTQKPVELCIWFLDKFSKTKDIVVDIFGGSGSTLIACEKLGRKCRMMEIDEHYCDVIIRRWEDYTGKKAELL